MLDLGFKKAPGIGPSWHRRLFFYFFTTEEIFGRMIADTLDIFNDSGWQWQQLWANWRSLFFVEAEETF